YFDDAISDQVLQHAAYRRAGRRVRNSQDGIFQDGGRSLILTPRKDGDGYAAAFDIGLGIT
ncbi:MAG: twin-arginine translocation pathway signal protein, partial [Herminiimonas sp.]|nr:twin-arginine translocation pathway signal protein [Herminiimonas sp.]